MRWLRRWLNRRIVADLREQRAVLVPALREEYPPHPHTQGMYDGINRALDALDR